MATSSAAMDEQNLLLVMVLEAFLPAWGRGDLPALHDLYTQEALALCPAPPAPLGPRPGPLPGDLAYAGLEPRAHPRFAAGRVLPRPFIAAVGAPTRFN